MDEVDRDLWNRTAKHSPTPLLNHEWLHHLETSGSISRQSGWEPNHLTVHEEGELIGAVPLYLRNTSWGEFVFDIAFAEVAQSIGSAYYPKLVGMSPATPSTAFHILSLPGREDAVVRAALAAMEEQCQRERIPVLQFNFVLPEQSRNLVRAGGLVPWKHHGFSWFNEGYTSFEDYVHRFTKGQRRNIRRERRSLREHGLETVIVPGTEAPDRYFERMAEYYLRTNARFGPWAARFLSDEFFTTMPVAVRRHVWFSAAVPKGNDRDPVALALLVRKGDRVLGRYWGTREDLKDLHFNVCYYAPIEWAIREGIQLFDPGMGSEHKIRRGFRSISTVSLHRFFDPSMQAILESNMERINAIQEQQIATLNDAIPFRGEAMPV